MSDPITTVTEILLREGAAPGSNMHSWRCEYPDRYGACDCVRIVATEIVEALTGQDFTARREHAAERRFTRDWPPPAPTHADANA